MIGAGSPFEIVRARTASTVGMQCSPAKGACRMNSGQTSLVSPRIRSRYLASEGVMTRGAHGS